MTTMVMTIMTTMMGIMLMILKMMYLQKYSSQGRSSRPLWRFQKASPQSRSRLSKTAFEQTPRLMMMRRSRKQIFNISQRIYPDRFAKMRFIQEWRLNSPLFMNNTQIRKFFTHIYLQYLQHFKRLGGRSAVIVTFLADKVFFGYLFEHLWGR